jgi:flagellar biosynthesis/type III secretory pathway protein FliH
MFDINKLYNSHIQEIADIAEVIYDNDGTDKGLSGDDVQRIADKLIDLEASIDDMIKQEREDAKEETVEEVEEKYKDIEKEIDKAKDEAYDEGFEAGYEDGVAFKSTLERI